MKENCTLYKNFACSDSFFCSRSLKVLLPGKKIVPCTCLPGKTICTRQWILVPCTKIVHGSDDRMHGTNWLLCCSHPDQEGTNEPLTGKV